MSEEAIRDDVDVSEAEEAATETTGRELTERELRLAEIARQNDELNGITYDDPEPESEPQAVAPDPLEELGYYRNQAGELVTKMKINGEEREVKADQVKAYLQKDIAGDYKLQQAAERERRLQEAETLLKRREQEMRTSLSRQLPKMGAEEAKKHAKAVLERIWDGDEEKAIDALIEFQQRTQATVDPEQIRMEAERSALSAIEQRETQRKQAEWQSSVDEGNRFLSENHPEIYQDQRLFDLVNGETARMVQRQMAGDPEFAKLTPKEIISRAADEVQGWMTGRKEQPPEAGTREGRKSNLKPMPRGLSTVQPAKKSTELDMSPKAVIERMRSSRAVM